MLTSYIDEGQLDSAIIILDKQRLMGEKNATTHEPFFHAYYSNFRKVRLLLEKEDVDGAMQAYDYWLQFVMANSKSEQTKSNVKNLGYFFRAKAHLLGDELEKANTELENYKTALASENDRYRLLKSQVLTQQNQFEPALQLVAQTDMSNARNRFQKGILLQQLGKEEDAISTFKSILQMNERDDIDLALVRKKTAQLIAKWES